MTGSGTGRDTLNTLLRIRRTSLDDAQRALAEALGHQQRMQTIREAEESRYAMETVAALDLTAGDEAVDAFARWLPVGRKSVAAAREAEQEALGDMDRARVVLGLARVAYRSVELLIEKCAEAARQLRDRREQQAMDELGSRRLLP